MENRTASALAFASPSESGGAPSPAVAARAPRRLAPEGEGDGGPDEPVPNPLEKVIKDARVSVRAMRRRRRADAPRPLEINDWGAPDSESSSDTDASSGGGGGPVRGGGHGAAPPPVPPPPDPPAPGIGGPGEPRGLADALAPHGGDWRRIDTDVSTFILDPYTGSIGCHCKKHGMACKVNKVRTKSPIGFFAAWISACDDPRFATKAIHGAAKRDRTEPAGVLSYARRAEGRHRWQADRQFAALFDWKPIKNGPELVSLG